MVSEYAIEVEILLHTFLLGKGTRSIVGFCCAFFQTYKRWLSEHASSLGWIKQC